MMKNKDLSWIALVCGGLGLFGGLLPVIGKWYITLPLAIVGIALGCKGRKAARAAGESMAMATAGLTMGILGVIFAALKLLLLVLVVGLGISVLSDLAGALLGLLQ